MLLLLIKLNFWISNKYMEYAKYMIKAKPLYTFSFNKFPTCLTLKVCLSRLYFLNDIFHKSYLVHSWILCLIYTNKLLISNSCVKHELNSNLKQFVNPLTTDVSHHIETSQLICNEYQLTDFYMMGNIGR